MHAMQYVTFYANRPEPGCFITLEFLLLVLKEKKPFYFQIFEDRFPNDVRIPIPNSELHKVDGALTCRCILVQKPL